LKVPLGDRDIPSPAESMAQRGAAQRGAARSGHVQVAEPTPTPPPQPPTE